MSLVIISLLVFIIIAILILSKLDMVRTRTTLALAGIFVVCLGIVAGWGWGMIFGMPFTPLQRELLMPSAFSAAASSAVRARAAAHHANGA